MFCGTCCLGSDGAYAQFDLSDIPLQPLKLFILAYVDKNRWRLCTFFSGVDEVAVGLSRYVGSSQR